jgi:hypothetical protein
MARLTPRRPKPAPEPALEASRGSPWIGLTDLGRLYGLSALQTGRLLQQAGLRQANGDATAEALARGQALQRHQHRPLWHRQACAAALEGPGLQTVARQTLVEQWADLLDALQLGSASISTSAEDMASEMPAELVEPVNRRLQQLGSPFQVGVRPAGGRHRRATPA